MGSERPSEPYTAGLTEHAFDASAPRNQKYIGPAVEETVASDPSVYPRGMETHTAQGNATETFPLVPVSQPPMTHLDATPVASGYAVPSLPVSVPGATMATPAPENATPQSAERVMEALSGGPPTYGPEPGLSDQTYYLEARPFNLQRPTEGEDYLFGREFGDFDGMTGDLLSFDYLF